MQKDNILDDHLDFENDNLTGRMSVREDQNV
jgi:hypothetical protein